MNELRMIKLKCSTEDDPNYTFRRCKYQHLLRNIVDICGCFPVYMLDGKDLVEGDWPPCSFYMHATCVSMTKQMVDNIQTLCKPGCVEYSIHQESIHVSKYELLHSLVPFLFSTQNSARKAKNF